MDERMLLLSLQRHGQALTVRQLAAHWEPTWTHEEIGLILSLLEQSGDVVREEGSISRYRASQRGSERLQS